MKVKEEAERRREQQQQKERQTTKFAHLDICAMKRQTKAALPQHLLHSVQHRPVAKLCCIVNISKTHKRKIVNHFSLPRKKCFCFAFCENFFQNEYDLLLIAFTLFVFYFASFCCMQESTLNKTHRRGHESSTRAGGLSALQEKIIE